MTIKVLEHNGIYTAYRRIMKRSDDGQLYESVKRIDFPFLPPDEADWQDWSMSLSTDSLDVGLQIFFDKWNFGNGGLIEERAYRCLYKEQQRRKWNDDDAAKISVTPKNGLSSRPSHQLEFPLIAK